MSTLVLDPFGSLLNHVRGGVEGHTSVQSAGGDARGAGRAGARVSSAAPCAGPGGAVCGSKRVPAGPRGDPAGVIQMGRSSSETEHVQGQTALREGDAGVSAPCRLPPLTPQAQRPPRASQPVSPGPSPGAGPAVARPSHKQSSGAESRARGTLPPPRDPEPRSEAFPSSPAASPPL